MDGFLVAMGLAFLVFGILLMSKELMVVTGRQMMWILVIGMLPAMVWPVISVVKSSAEMPGSLVMLGVPLMYIAMLAFLRKAMGNLVLFNVSEDTVYESVMAALKEQGVPFEEKRGRLLVPSMDSDVRINTQGNMGTAVVILSPGLRRVRAELHRSIRRSLSGRRFDGFPTVGVAYVILAVFLLIMAVGVGSMSCRRRRFEEKWVIDPEAHAVIVDPAPAGSGMR